MPSSKLTTLEQNMHICHHTNQEVSVVYIVFPNVYLPIRPKLLEYRLWIRSMFGLLWHSSTIVNHLYIYINYNFWNFLPVLQILFFRKALRQICLWICRQRSMSLRVLTACYYFGLMACVTLLLLKMILLRYTSDCLKEVISNLYEKYIYVIIH